MGGLYEGTSELAAWGMMGEDTTPNPCAQKANARIHTHTHTHTSLLDL